MRRQVLDGIAKEGETRIVRNRVQSLRLHACGIAIPFVTHTQIQSQSWRHFPVILDKAIQRILVTVEQARTRSTQRAVIASRHEVVYELVQRLVVPLTACARQEVRGSDPAM